MMTVLITGASSGIGAGLAKSFAADGHLVIACGRDASRLAALQQLSPNISVRLFDMTDRDACRQALTGCFADLIILCAGTCEYLDHGQVDAALVERVMATNFLGPVNCLAALQTQLEAGDRVVLVSSMAHWLPFPRAEAYGASKAALSWFANSLRLDWESKGDGALMNIAIIGSGIAGLTCAWRLAGHHQVTLFEAGATPGGHTATVDVATPQGTWAIDTGFIVYNDRTYPRFMGLLSELGIAGQKTQMSFSVHNPASGLEYNGHSLTSLFAQRRNLLKPAFWGLLSEIVRFNRLAKLALTEALDPGATLESFLTRHRFSPFFARHYILPMGAAIWSSSLQEMRRFPLPLFLRFFENHGLLDIRDRPQWYVVPGGSREYVRALLARLGDRLDLRLNAPVQQVDRHPAGVTLRLASGEAHFDQVIFACHSAQALAMLAAPTDSEREVLGDIGWQRNEVVLHSDPRWLPERQRAWASWNYRLSDGDRARACVTYNMNILQGLPAGAPLFCVTLNPDAPVDDRYVWQRFVYEHPLFNPQSWSAQLRREEINGQQRSWYCGAYWYNGFHEDGVRSALDVVQGIAVAEGN